MAYPFVQPPTLAEFIARVTSAEFGCTFETVENPMYVDGDENHCVSIHFLKRGVGNEAKNYAIYNEDFDVQMTPTYLRSICVRLGIELSAFGYSVNEDASEPTATRASRIRASLAEELIEE